MEEPYGPGVLAPYLEQFLQVAVEHPDMEDAQLAQLLTLSPSTVKMYWHRIFGTLGVHHRAAAEMEALRRGLLRLSPPDDG